MRGGQSVSGSSRPSRIGRISQRRSIAPPKINSSSTIYPIKTQSEIPTQAELKLSPRLPESKGKVRQEWLLHRLDDNSVRNYRASGALHDHDSRQD
jgi:hypothetical protein